MSSKKILKIVYIVLFLLALVIPGIWTFVGRQENIGNEETVDFSDANYMNISEKIDSYMSTGFGFRNKLVQMNNQIYLNVFGESGEPSVIVGKDDWLFYESALHDYTGEDRLSDTELEKIARVLEIAKSAVEGQGAEFIFACAPNKMEIYGEYMPYYCYESKESGNYEKLYSALAARGITAVDLKAVLKSQAEASEEIIYHKLDSHWNNLGAAYAYEAIMQEAGLEYIDFTNSQYTVKSDFDGDLYAMLFPNGSRKDEQVYFDREAEFYYVSKYRGPEDLLIETMADNSEGSLLMYRDSFGNALHTFMAESFGYSVFSRALPYDLTGADEYSLVVLEIVERNIGNLLEYPPVIKAAKVELDNIEQTDTEIMADFTASSGMNYITVQCGEIPQSTNVYIRVNGDIYEAYPCGRDADASVYVDEGITVEEVSVIYEDAGKYFETLIYLKK